MLCCLCLVCSSLSSYSTRVVFAREFNLIFISSIGAATRNGKLSRTAADLCTYTWTSTDTMKKNTTAWKKHWCLCYSLIMWANRTITTTLLPVQRKQSQRSRHRHICWWSRTLSGVCMRYGRDILLWVWFFSLLCFFPSMDSFYALIMHVCLSPLLANSCLYHS